MTKTIFCAVCLLCATAGYGQSAGVLSNLAQPLQMADHPQHAAQHAMATEDNLLGNSAYSYAKGEVPLAELTSPMYEVPLGDIARAYRKEHASTAKAAKVSEN